MEDKLMVSVDMITYNHEAYIAQAIHGVLMQETSFHYDLIISDDCSPDNTESIVRDIINKHPKGHLIKYFRHEKNIGMNANGSFAVNQCHGKYIALCEGDDYWSDPLKLQRQVDFMEVNEEYSGCFHDCTIFFQESHESVRNSSEANVYSKDVFHIEDFIENLIINTCTILFRKESFKIPAILVDMVTDKLLFQLLSLNGPLKFLKFEMAVYRKHIGGITSAGYSKDLVNTILFRWELFDNYTNFKYTSLISKQKRKLVFNYEMSLKNQNIIKKIILLIRNYDLVLEQSNRLKRFKGKV